VLTPLTLNCSLTLFKTGVGASYMPMELPSRVVAKVSFVIRAGQLARINVVVGLLLVGGVVVVRVCCRRGHFAGLRAAGVSRDLSPNELKPVGLFGAGAGEADRENVGEALSAVVHGAFGRHLHRASAVADRLRCFELALGDVGGRDECLILAAQPG